MKIFQENFPVSRKVGLISDQLRAIKVNNYNDRNVVKFVIEAKTLIFIKTILEFWKLHFALLQQKKISKKLQNSL